MTFLLGLVCLTAAFALALWLFEDRHPIDRERD